MENYQVKVTEYAEKIAELTATIESLEKSRGDHNEAELEEVKVEIKLVEALINELQASMKKFMYMVPEVHLPFSCNSLLVQWIPLTFFSGSCEHGGIIKVSKPIVSQLNAQLSSSYIYGGWGKDSKPLAGRESMYWFAGSSSTSVSSIKLYSDYKNLILRKYFLDQWLNYHTSGNNYIIRANTLYYDTNSRFGVAKLNFTSMIYETKDIPGAGPISYSLYPNQYFDFAADESGLWLIYATEESKGMLFVAKINEESFEVEEQIQTSVYKPSASNAFVVCGVLYVVRTVDITTEEIFYTFDLKTKQESYISIPFERFLDKYSSLDYNPTDQKLYMYSEGYYVNYQVWFGNNTAEATV
uniref:Si:ch211-173a9.6 n=1 Tax=Salarias fasciatus TaxID=181472 RepID=A0A672G522_SALFA